ncbi:hypothetical protein MPSEU_000950700 [Mayamaea pseudoterrestris]|nr:hypothetical protein MPSEU_000950700 [Mayamaea pseudoterrestris]
MDEETAREEAEARRLKILQEADERLGLVTGETVKKDGGDDAAPTISKPSGSARLAAMRKRRFKKGQVKEHDKEELDEQPPIEATVAAAEEEPVAHVAATEPASAHAFVSVDGETRLEEPESTPFDEPSNAAHDDSIHTANRNQKKYMGVARMRRQKLKERQDETNQADATTDSLETIVPNEKVSAVMARRRKQVHLLPILMHFVTTVLLFLAGFDVGWQQNAVLTASVHTQLAPRQVGLHILKRNSNKLIDKWSSWTGASAALDEKTQALLQEDEFGDAKVNYDDPIKAENIDWPFGVDLDMLTQADTIINRFARVAIFIHRSFVKLLFMPMTFASNIISGFAQLLTIPPLLCIVALLIRQFVGKVILGAKLPDRKPPDESEGKDVVSMGTSFVKSFITKAFPKVFTVYDAWSHLRTDMFVVLCGLIVGFTLQYQLQMLPLSVRLPAEEIAVVHHAPPPMEPIVEETVTTGDEL